jgi:nucleotide-binding universal stress UspA family protein
MSRLDRILVATDLTPGSEPAFAEALRLASEDGAELVVAHAYEMPYLADSAVIAPATLQELDVKTRAELDARLSALAERAQARGVRARPLMLFGSPYEAIPRAVAEEHADLLVAGTHGRHGLERLLLGSVASSLLTSSACPVLTVRAA